MEIFYFFPILPSTSFLIYTVLLLTNLRFNSGGHGNWHDRCSNTFNCGNITGVDYPFSGNNRPKECGFPGLELNCNKFDDSTTIWIMNVKYRVLGINQTANILTITREDFVAGVCQGESFNATLDSNLFGFASRYVNFTYNFTCPPTVRRFPGVESMPPVPEGFECLASGFNLGNGYVQFGDPARAGTCEASLVVPVRNSTAEAGEYGSDVWALKGILEEGFDVKWKVDGELCRECKNSGGQCGFDLKVNRFACWCPEHYLPSIKTCRTSTGGSTSLQLSPLTSVAPVNNNSKSNKTPLGIGLGIAGAVLAGVGIGWLIFRQKRKRVAAQGQEHEEVQPVQTKNKGLPTPPSSNSLSSDPSPRFMRSIPSYPTSGSVTLFGTESFYFGAQIFTYAELEEATNNFDQSRELGDGGFGTVFYGKLPDGRVVAVKRLYENNFKRVEQFMNEVEILTKLRHDNLVVLYGCTSKQSRDLLLVYEYIPNGTVADHLHGKRAKSGLLSWPIRLNIAIETAEALAFLHKSDIIHRDVKTNNILLDNDFHVKVADFGLSRLFPNNVTHVSTAPQGTPGYVDPEYYQVYQLTEKSDVYSLGVVLIELISSLQAVDTNRHRHDINLSNMAIDKIQNHALHELVDPSLGFVTNSSARRMITLVAELAFRCLQHVRDMRPSMQEVVDALRRIQNEEMNGNDKVEVLDIVVDDVALLKGNSTSSPDSSVTDKWASSSTPNSIG